MTVERPEEFVFQFERKRMRSTLDAIGWAWATNHRQMQKYERPLATTCKSSLPLRRIVKCIWYQLVLTIGEAASCIASRLGGSDLKGIRWAWTTDQPQTYATNTEGRWQQPVNPRCFCGAPSNAYVINWHRPLTNLQAV